MCTALRAPSGGLAGEYEGAPAHAHVQNLCICVHGMKCVTPSWLVSTHVFSTSRTRSSLVFILWGRVGVHCHWHVTTGHMHIIYFGHGLSLGACAQ